MSEMEHDPCPSQDLFLGVRQTLECFAELLERLSSLKSPRNKKWTQRMAPQCGDQWIGLRENLQKKKLCFMGKSIWFPVDFPLTQSNLVTIEYYRKTCIFLGSQLQQDHQIARRNIMVDTPGCESIKLNTIRLYPINAPCMVYLPTKLGDFGRSGKCWCAYTSTMGCIWVSEKIFFRTLNTDVGTFTWFLEQIPMASSPDGAKCV